MLTINVDYILKGERLELVEEVSLVFEGGRLVGIDEGWNGNGIRAHALAMPGLINGHVHLGDSVIPERWIDKELSEIVDPSKGLKLRALSKVDRKDIVDSMSRTIKIMKSFGIMGVADFREQGVKGVRMGLEAAKKARYQGYLPFGRVTKEEELLKLVEVSHGLGLPEPSWPNKSLAKRAAAVFRSFGKPIGTHVAEVGGADELYEALELGVNFVVHGINLELEHFEELKRRNVAVVMCPRANMWFKMEPKIHLAIEAEAKLLLGTDNAAWTKPNLWREMELSALLLKRRGIWDEDVAREILKAVTVNAQEALKVPWKVAIEKGSDGPIILLDLNEIELNWTPNKYTAIVKRGSPNAVVAYIEKGRYNPLRVR